MDEIPTGKIVKFLKERALRYGETRLSRNKEPASITIEGFRLLLQKTIHEEIEWPDS